MKLAKQIFRLKDETSKDNEKERNETNTITKLKIMFACADLRGCAFELRISDGQVQQQIRIIQQNTNTNVLFSISSKSWE